MPLNLNLYEGKSLYDTQWTTSIHHAISNDYNIASLKIEETQLLQKKEDDNVTSQKPQNNI